MTYLIKVMACAPNPAPGGPGSWPISWGPAQASTRQNARDGGELGGTPGGPSGLQAPVVPAVPGAVHVNFTLFGAPPLVRGLTHVRSKVVSSYR